MIIGYSICSCFILYSWMWTFLIFYLNALLFLITYELLLILIRVWIIIIIVSNSIYGVHDEAKDKDFELEMSWVCDDSNRQHVKVCLGVLSVTSICRQFVSVYNNDKYASFGWGLVVVFTFISFSLSSSLFFFKLYFLADDKKNEEKCFWR